MGALGVRVSPTCKITAAMIVEMDAGPAQVAAFCAAFPSGLDYADPAADAANVAQALRLGLDVRCFGERAHLSPPARAAYVASVESARAAYDEAVAAPRAAYAAAVESARTAYYEAVESAYYEAVGSAYYEAVESARAAYDEAVAAPCAAHDAAVAPARAAYDEAVAAAILVALRASVSA